MAMTKINFEDLPNTTTPVNASNLNQVQTNVDNAKLDKTGGEISGNLNVTGTLKKGNVDVLTETSGSWTPSLSTIEGASPTVTYTYRYGYYTKIGNMVYICFKLRGKITALNGTNNYGIVTGLPFNVDSSKRQDGMQSITLGEFYDLIVNPSTPYLWLGLNHIRIQNNYGSGAGILKITSGAYFDFAGSGWYQTA